MLNTIYRKRILLLALLFWTFVLGDLSYGQRPEVVSKQLYGNVEYFGGQGARFVVSFTDTLEPRAR